MDLVRLAVISVVVQMMEVGNRWVTTELGDPRGKDLKSLQMVEFAADFELGEVDRRDRYSDGWA